MFKKIAFIALLVSANVSAGLLSSTVSTVDPRHVEAASKSWTVIETVRLGRTDAPIHLIEVWRSPSTKTVDEAAVDLGLRLRALTDEYGVETCAVICRSPSGGHSAAIVTIKATLACPVAETCPKGDVFVDADIHAHPAFNLFKPSAVDRLYLKQDYGRNGKTSTTPSVISSNDLESKDGYVVTDTEIKHHTGTQSSARVIHKIVDPVIASAKP